METEIWPNLIARCEKNSLPVLYVNVRLSAQSHRGYVRFARLVAPALCAVKHFAAQGEADANRLINLGAPAAAVSVVGNVKFDIAPAHAIEKAAIEKSAHGLRGKLGRERAVWVVGSTHDGEEIKLLDAFARLRTDLPKLLLVIVPRHPQRFGVVARICKRRKFNLRLYSKHKSKLPADTEIYLVDAMGELPRFLAAADVAFIGGSLTAIGGHNILESLAVGTPVIFGRHMFNFAEIADLVVRESAGVQVMDVDELVEVVRRFLTEPALAAQFAQRGRELMVNNRGALAKICDLVDAEIADIADISKSAEKPDI